LPPVVVVVVSPLQLLVAGALGRIERRRRIHIRKQSGRRRRSTRKKKASKQASKNSTVRRKKKYKTKPKTKEFTKMSHKMHKLQDDKTTVPLYFNSKIPFFFFCRLLQNGSGSGSGSLKKSRLD
jgi:DNA polymerase III alpha subunit